MVTIRTNIGDIVDRLETKLAILKDKERIVRSCAVQITGFLRQRIHVDGLDAKGKSIGEYSSAYLKLRQKKYNRTSDKKIILSLTSQQENDMGPVETTRGYGIGFKNPLNLAKAGWAEDRAGSSDSDNIIYTLSTDEIDNMRVIIQDETNKIMTND